MSDRVASLRARHRPADALRDLLDDTRRLMAETDDATEREALRAEATRLAAEIDPSAVMSPRTDGFDVLAELDRLEIRERTTPRVRDRQGHLVDLDHPLLAKVRELLAAAGSDEERVAILAKAANVAAEQTIADHEAASAEAHGLGVAVSGMPTNLDFALVDAVHAEGHVHGLDFTGLASDTFRDEPMPAIVGDEFFDRLAGLPHLPTADVTP